MSDKPNQKLLLRINEYIQKTELTYEICKTLSINGFKLHEENNAKCCFSCEIEYHLPDVDNELKILHKDGCNFIIENLLEELEETTNVTQRLLSFWQFDWRLKGFKVDQEVLAKSGFYCVMNNDQVKCAYCDVELEDWTEDDIPDQVHLELSELCPYLNSIKRKRENSKLFETNSSKDDRIHKRISYELYRMLSFPDDDVDFELARKLSKNGLYYNEGRICCYLCDFEENVNVARTQGEEIFNFHICTNEITECINVPYDDSDLPRSEATRLIEFLVHGTKKIEENGLGAIKLAREGFILRENQIQCYFCEEEINDEIKHNVTCPMLHNDIDSENNIKLYDTLNDYKAFHDGIGALPESSKSMSTEDVETTFLNSTIIHDGDLPRFPKYEDLDDRTDSFNLRPNTSYEMKEALSQSGFFWSLEKNTCICFHCNFRHNEWYFTQDTPLFYQALSFHRESSPTCKLVNPDY